MPKIIVVDDSKLLREVFAELLRKAGHTVETWDPPSASDAMGLVRDAAPDLMILDYQMPSINGATLTRMARRALKDLPIIAVTAHQDPSIKTMLMTLPVNEILYKPIHQEDLLKAVAKVLGT